MCRIARPKPTCMLIQLLKKLHLIAYFCINKNLESVAHFHLLNHEAFVLMFLLFGVLVEYKAVLSFFLFSFRFFFSLFCFCFYFFLIFFVFLFFFFFSFFCFYFFPIFFCFYFLFLFCFYFYFFLVFYCLYGFFFAFFFVYFSFNEFFLFNLVC